MWWPGRDLQCHLHDVQLSDAECKFAYAIQEGNDTSLSGSIAGQRCSSTRTELAAGILAATAPCSVHQATDSRVYCNKVNLMLNGKSPASKRPWGIQTDGDLWGIMERVIGAKRPCYPVTLRR